MGLRVTFSFDLIFYIDYSVNKRTSLHVKEKNKKRCTGKILFTFQ